MNGCIIQYHKARHLSFFVRTGIGFDERIKGRDNGVRCHGLFGCVKKQVIITTQKTKYIHALAVMTGYFSGLATALPPLGHTRCCAETGFVKIIKHQFAILFLLFQGLQVVFITLEVDFIALSLH